MHAIKARENMKRVCQNDHILYFLSYCSRHKILSVLRDRQENGRYKIRSYMKRQKIQGVISVYTRVLTVKQNEQIVCQLTRRSIV